jgi:hypothetical protein
MLELNLLYYLFLYRKLKSCSLIESEIIQRIWTNGSDFGVFAPGFSSYEPTFFDLVRIADSLRETGTIELIEREDRARTTDYRFTHRYNRETGVVEAIEEDSIVSKYLNLLLCL